MLGPGLMPMLRLASRLCRAASCGSNSDSGNNASDTLMQVKLPPRLADPKPSRKSQFHKIQLSCKSKLKDFSILFYFWFCFVFFFFSNAPLTLDDNSPVSVISFACSQLGWAAREAPAARSAGQLQQPGAARGQRIRSIAIEFRSNTYANHRCGEYIE